VESTIKREALGHAFADAQLFEQALTHRSAGRRNNERLEFLGDALVNLIVAEFVYEQHPRASEGDMTRLRASLVSGSALAELARVAEVGDLVRLGAGELKTGGFRRESILADTFEALVAAIYLDAGWETCRSVVRTQFAARIVGGDPQASKDAKTSLQEVLQGRGMALPIYELVSSTGEEHAKVFEVSCTVASLGLHALGTGLSRRAAEQLAAEQVLAEVQVAIDPRRTAQGRA